MEIDPHAVKARLTPIRGAITEFLEWCDVVEFTADSGFNITSVAHAEADKLKAALDVLKRTL